ncbi:MAG: sugar phosphate isomerase/epimerase [Clostridia bacterium]|nr:sugar phosphate isomerase/epimerase [Clostridia bacterium]
MKGCVQMSRVNVFAFADEASPFIDGQITAMVRNGLQGLEIRGVDETNVSEITPDKAKEVREKLDARGLRVWSVGSPIGKIKITDSFAPHLEVFRHTLEIAHILGAVNMRIFSFYIPSGEDPASYRDEVMERMGTLLEISRDSGILLCHENEKGIYGDVPQRCLDLHRTYPGLGGVFDPANFVQCGIDTAEAWDLLKDHVKYLHIKDALADGTIVPCGKGAGQIPEILKEYVAMGGSVVTLEPHLKVFHGLDALEESGDVSIIRDNEYPDSDTAFDVACNAFNKILAEV